MATAPKTTETSSTDKTYIATMNVFIFGKRYKAGDVVRLTAEQAAQVKDVVTDSKPEVAQAVQTVAASE